MKYLAELIVPIDHQLLLVFPVKKSVYSNPISAITYLASFQMNLHSRLRKQVKYKILYT